MGGTFKTHPVYVSFISNFLHHNLTSFSHIQGNTVKAVKYWIFPEALGHRVSHYSNTRLIQHSCGMICLNCQSISTPTMNIHNTAASTLFCTFTLLCTTTEPESWKPLKFYPLQILFIDPNIKQLAVFLFLWVPISHLGGHTWADKSPGFIRESGSFLWHICNTRPGRWTCPGVRTSYSTKTYLFYIK